MLSLENCHHVIPETVVLNSVQSNLLLEILLSSSYEIKGYFPTQTRSVFIKWDGRFHEFLTLLVISLKSNSSQNQLLLFLSRNINQSNHLTKFRLKWTQQREEGPWKKVDTVFLPLLEEVELCLLLQSMNIRKT